ncbi:hypothetical protein BDF22DRAFT_741651 [Syncephalis plumigaleata]|nr:hypothetical protein BDF22DRAFT_741651 [Syncephalis plumigaleata]
MNSGVQVYIITGANRGYGLAIAKALAAEIADPAKLHLILVGRNFVSLANATEELEGLATTYLVYSVNFSCMDELDNNIDRIFSAYREIRTRYQVSRVVLVNNAGTLGDAWHSIAEQDWKFAQTYYNVNLVSFFAITARFLKTVRSDHAIIRQVVNISSLMAVLPTERFSLYSSAKAARDSLITVAAKEEAESGIKTLNYAPGPMDTDMQTEMQSTLQTPEHKALHAQFFPSKDVFVDPAVSASKLIQLLNKNTFESGAHIDYFDLD